MPLTTEKLIKSRIRAEKRIILELPETVFYREVRFSDNSVV
jgi:hypothetical protein